MPSTQLIQIDIKDNDEKAVRETLRIIQSNRRQKTTIVGSLFYNDLIRRIEPSVATFASWQDVSRV